MATPTAPNDVSAPPPTTASPLGDTGLRRGRTPDGLEFDIPTTDSMFRTLLTPSRYGPLEIITLLCLIGQLLSVFLIPYLPLAFYLAQFAFWRLSYNLGLGLILRAQSRHSLITNTVANLQPSQRTLLHAVAARGVPPPYEWSRAPPAFNAWVVFRALATLVLANDGFSFAVAAVACFRPLRTTADFIIFFVCAVMALPLGALGYWAKAEAHHTLSDYAWFWGDFFFSRLGDSFTSSGVFALFPHPMYTVGYGPYYTAILLTRSYHLALVAVLAHTAQILFLMLFEEPHMEKLYGGGSSSAGEAALGEDDGGASDNAALRLFEQASPHPTVLGALMAATLLPLFLSISTSARPSLIVLVTVAIRAAHWQALATFLPRGEGQVDNRWVMLLRARGSSHSRIFAAWQHVLAVSTFLNHGLFLACASALQGTPYIPFNSLAARDWALSVTGAALVAIGVSSAVWSVQTTGAFAYYYGDFFVQPTDTLPRYDGVYKYIGHPQAILSYLAYYGVALARQSWTLAVVAAACQAMHVVFVAWVEQPHMREEYALVRARAPVVERLLSVAGVRKAMVGARDVVVARGSAVGVGAKVDDLRRLAEVRADRLRADVEKRVAQWRHAVVVKATESSDVALEKVKNVDCDFVSAKLRSFGVKVEPVGPSLTVGGT